MTEVNGKPKPAVPDLNGKSWADLCDSSQSQDDLDSPLKGNNAGVKDDDDDDDDLYDLVFKPVKKETVRAASQDDLSLTSFMNNVHMVTPVKQEDGRLPPTDIIDEDTVCSPFVKDESRAVPDEKPRSPEESLNKDVLQAKRRLTSECEPAVSDPVTPERAAKFNKKSTDHTNIHDSAESPKYARIVMNMITNF